MKKKQYSTEQIIGFLKAHEAGAKVPDLVRKHGFSEQSFYRWKSKYGGLEVPDAKRLKELEQESARLKKIRKNHAGFRALAYIQGDDCKLVSRNIELHTPFRKGAPA